MSAILCVVNLTSKIIVFHWVKHPWSVCTLFLAYYDNGNYPRKSCVVAGIFGSVEFHITSTPIYIYIYIYRHRRVMTFHTSMEVGLKILRVANLTSERHDISPIHGNLLNMQYYMLWIWHRRIMIFHPPMEVCSRNTCSRLEKLENIMYCKFDIEKSWHLTHPWKFVWQQKMH